MKVAEMMMGVKWTDYRAIFRVFSYTVEKVGV